MRRLILALPFALSCGDKDDASIDDTSTDCEPVTFYADADGDGLGDPDATTDDCAAPSGYVENADDCDDTDDAVLDGIDWYIDADGDGHGGETVLSACEAPSGYVAGNDDCDDSDPDVWQLGTAWIDADGDGFGGEETEVCGTPDGTATNGNDCDDDNADAYPGADEPCSSTVDLDCDGLLPETDLDGDGQAAIECGGTDCDDGDETVYQGAEELCDDIDQDCDGDASMPSDCAMEDCLAWLDAGQTTDGEYEIDPDGDGTSFTAYCDMTTDGGGWTLLFNYGATFDETDNGASGSCYSTECISEAYSTVSVGTDLMFDMSDGAISGSSYEARAIVTDVGSSIQGQTLQTTFTTGSQYLVEKDDNSNVSTPDGCGSWSDFSNVICDTQVITLNDQDSGSFCPGSVHLIGASTTSTSSWDNCAGWPDAPNFGNTDYYPDNFRVWSR